MTYVNIYAEVLRTARLFGAPVLCTSKPVDRNDVPEGWYLYELYGTVKNPDVPYALADTAPEGRRVASVLSYVPLKSGPAGHRLVKDMFRLSKGFTTLAGFCEAEDIECPETPLRHRLRPASPEESELFYALPPERDRELGAIGHLRIDFGGSRTEFHHTWWPRGSDDLNTREFRDELKLVVDDAS